MRLLVLTALISFFTTGLSGQNLIGYKGNEIKKFMKEQRKEMNLNKVKNNSFAYLKYSDSSESQTLLLFLDTDSICHSIRIICDPGIKGQKINEFNSMYRKRGENSWIDSHNGKNYIIELKDEKFTSVFSMKLLE